LKRQKKIFLSNNKKDTQVEQRMSNPATTTNPTETKVITTSTEISYPPVSENQKIILGVGIIVGALTLTVPLYFLVQQMPPMGSTGAQNPWAVVFLAATSLVVVLYIIGVIYIALSNFYDPDSEKDNFEAMKSVTGIVVVTIILGILVIALGVLYAFTIWKVVITNDMLNWTSMAMYFISLIALIAIAFLATGNKKYLLVLVNSKQGLETYKSQIMLSSFKVETPKVKTEVVQQQPEAPPQQMQAETTQTVMPGTETSNPMTKSTVT
jgi:hypothetical protein